MGKIYGDEKKLKIIWFERNTEKRKHTLQILT